MGKVTITPDLIKDLKKYGEAMCVGMASQVRDELDLTAMSTIAAFYSHYEPTSYRRHGYNLVNNIHEKYYKNPHGSVVYGGIELSPDGLDDIYRGTTENIFNSVINGYHGYVENFLVRNPKATIPPVMSPSPLEILENKRDEIVSHINSYTKFGYDRAKSGSYSTLR